MARAALSRGVFEQPRSTLFVIISVSPATAKTPSPPEFENKLKKRRLDDKKKVSPD
jgi:hypothetical protein